MYMLRNRVCWGFKHVDVDSCLWYPLFIVYSSIRVHVVLNSVLVMTFSFITIEDAKVLKLKKPNDTFLLAMWYCVLHCPALYWPCGTVYCIVLLCIGHVVLCIALSSICIGHVVLCIALSSICIGHGVLCIALSCFVLAMWYYVLHYPPFVLVMGYYVLHCPPFVLAMWYCVLHCPALYWPCGTVYCI